MQATHFYGAINIVQFCLISDFKANMISLRLDKCTFIAYLAPLQSHHIHPDRALCVVNISTYWSKMHSGERNPLSTVSATNSTEPTRLQRARTQPTVRASWTLQEPGRMQSTLSTSPERQFRPLLSEKHD